jgi:predicted DNA-binding transcriptional regulator YafY
MQEDGTMLVDLEWPENEWLYNFLLSYGEEMEVLEPAHVRRSLASKAARVAALYPQT